MSTQHKMMFICFCERHSWSAHWHMQPVRRRHEKPPKVTTSCALEANEKTCRALGEKSFQAWVEPFPHLLYSVYDVGLFLWLREGGLEIKQSNMEYYTSKPFLSVALGICKHNKGPTSGWVMKQVSSIKSNHHMSAATCKSRYQDLFKWFTAFAPKAQRTHVPVCTLDMIVSVLCYKLLETRFLASLINLMQSLETENAV